MRQTDAKSKKNTERERGGARERENERDTNRQTVRHTNRHTDTQIKIETVKSPSNLSHNMEESSLEPSR